MVKIIGTRLHEGGKGSFVSLELQGDIVMIQSQNTGKFYATAMKCSMPSTFSPEVAKAMVGKEIPGRIERVQCEPYEYTIQDTGEVINLAHTYQYLPEEEKATAKQEQVNTMQHA